MLEIVELADEVRGRATGQWRDRPQALQVRPVTAGTGSRLPAAVCNECAPPLDTAGRDIRDEARARVATDEVGSRASPGLAAMCHPVTYGRGTRAVSTTVMFARGFNAEKYAAAVSISSAATALETVIIACGGNRDGTAVLRAPLLKSAICCTM
jgi:hypothetical protein